MNVVHVSWRVLDFWPFMSWLESTWHDSAIDDKLSSFVLLYSCRARNRPTVDSFLILTAWSNLHSAKKTIPERNWQDEKAVVSRNRATNCKRSCNKIELASPWTWPFWCVLLLATDSVSMKWLNMGWYVSRHGNYSNATPHRIPSWRDDSNTPNYQKKIGITKVRMVVKAFFANCKMFLPSLTGSWRRGQISDVVKFFLREHYITFLRQIQQIS